MHHRSWLESSAWCVNVGLSLSLLAAHVWLLIWAWPRWGDALDFVPWGICAVLAGWMGYRSSLGTASRRTCASPLLLTGFAVLLGLLEVALPRAHYPAWHADRYTTLAVSAVVVGMVVGAYDGLRRFIPLLVLLLAWLALLIFGSKVSAIHPNILFASVAAILLIIVPPFRPNRMVEALVAVALALFMTSHFRGFELMNPPIHCWFHGPYDPLSDLNERELERSEILVQGAVAALPWILAITLPWRDRQSPGKVPFKHRALGLGLAVTTLLALVGTREHLVRSLVVGPSGKYAPPSVTLPTIASALESLEGEETWWPILGIGTIASFDGIQQPSLLAAVEQAVQSFRRLQSEHKDDWQSPKGITIYADERVPMQDVLGALEAIAQQDIHLAAFGYAAPLPKPLAPSLKHVSQRRRAAFTNLSQQQQAPLPCNAPIFQLSASTREMPEPRESPRRIPLGEQPPAFVSVDPTMTYGDFLDKFLERFDFRFHQFWVRRSWAQQPECKASGPTAGSKTG